MFLTAVRFSARSALDAEFRQYAIQRAYLSKSALEQIQSNKPGKPQEMLADIQRAGFYAQQQRDKDETACDNTDDAFCVQSITPLIKVNEFYWIRL